MRHWVCLWKAGCDGGACRLCCLPPLSLAYFAAPLPRRGRISPRPALAERSSPPGKGEILVFLCKGLRPLHPRGWVGCGTGFACGKRDTAGGLLFWLPAAAVFSLLCRPHPPDPLPLRGRGRLRLFQARGFAPRIPGAGRDAALGLLVESGLWWGLLFWLPADLARNLLFFSSPFPGGKTGHKP